MTNVVAIKCSKCRKDVFYMSDEFEMQTDVVCVPCQKGRNVRRARRTAVSIYAKIKKGIRSDVHPNHHFRSPTEANFARILNYLNIKWDYENKTFMFDKFGYRTKPFVYIMDFELLSGTDKFPAGYYEIKGYMKPQCRQKLRRLKKCYPEDFKKTIVVLYNKYKKKDIEFCEKLGYRYMLYDQLTQEFSSELPVWE